MQLADQTSAALFWRRHASCNRSFVNVREKPRQTIRQHCLVKASRPSAAQLCYLAIPDKKAITQTETLLLPIPSSFTRPYQKGSCPKKLIQVQRRSGRNSVSSCFTFRKCPIWHWLKNSGRATSVSISVFGASGLCEVNTLTTLLFSRYLWTMVSEANFCKDSKI